MRAGARLQETARRLWRWFFPPRVRPPDELLELLKTVYPTLDLSKVSFHLGTPHLIRLVGSMAITIPAMLAPKRTRIYIEARHYDPASVSGVGTLVHEAYHALQVQESGWGFGPFRPFMILYFACGAANGFRYHGHPLEEDAYRLAGRRRSAFEAACGAALPGTESVACLAAESSEVRFWRKLAASSPGCGRLAASERRALVLLGSPLIASWLLVWTLAGALTWTARLLVEALGAAAAGLLWAVGAIVSRIELSLYRHTEEV
ncbi:MAG: hypothetical protein ACJ75H_23400 [Thermoanaerobaculia bacterium]